MIAKTQMPGNEPMPPEALRSALKDLGLEPKEAAQRMGVTASTVYRWRSGANTIPVWAMALINAWQENRRLQQEIEALYRPFVTSREQAQRIAMRDLEARLGTPTTYVDLPAWRQT